jgi:prephenate dehydrogenase
VYFVAIQWRGGPAEGGRPNNAAWISAVSRSWAGVIGAAFVRCSVEHEDRMCTGIAFISHMSFVCVH